MSEDSKITWRMLVVEDKEDISRQIVEAIPGFVDEPDTAEGEQCRNFAQAVKLMETKQFDILILDLKDDNETLPLTDETNAGLEVFDVLKKTRFAPVVFYTAYAYKVKSEETSFVRVVEKTQGLAKLEEEVRHVIQTKLPRMVRRLEEVRREYMWEFVTRHWKDFADRPQHSDLAYLLARRLASYLESSAREIATTTGDVSQVPEGYKAHPMVMYTYPPVSGHQMACNILKKAQDGNDSYWLVVTPSCDFAQGKAQNVVLAKCISLTDQPEYTKWTESPTKDGSSLDSLLRDNRQKSQPERFKFLPGTFFLPDLVVDFQQLCSVPKEEMSGYETVASMDSPFAEAIMARFSRYFGRLGTPDVDQAIVLKRLEKDLKKKSATGQ